MTLETFFFFNFKFFLLIYLENSFNIAKQVTLAVVWFVNVLLLSLCCFVGSFCQSRVSSLLAEILLSVWFLMHVNTSMQSNSAAHTDRELIRINN